MPLSWIMPSTEVTRKDSPTGERMVAKPYPKDDERRRGLSPHPP